MISWGSSPVPLYDSVDEFSQEKTRDFAANNTNKTAKIAHRTLTSTRYRQEVSPVKHSKTAYKSRLECQKLGHDSITCPSFAKWLLPSVANTSPTLERCAWLDSYHWSCATLLARRSHIEQRLLPKPLSCLDIAAKHVAPALFSVSYWIVHKSCKLASRIDVFNEHWKGKKSVLEAGLY